MKLRHSTHSPCAAAVGKSGGTGRLGKLSQIGFALAVALAAAPIAYASSHREAPFISGQPKVDGTDLYMFRSYEPGREGFVTILANYQPFQDPQGGRTLRCSILTRCTKSISTTAVTALKTSPSSSVSRTRPRPPR